MSQSYIKKQPLTEFELWQKKKASSSLFSFTLELTARCNHNCRHCYINLAEDDRQAKEQELGFDEIRAIVDQAVDLGAVWCLVTGGEPLLRDDFEEIYLYLKRKGLLVSVFTNGTLISSRQVELFRKYPPRKLEITVYGITLKTYTAVTRKPDLFASFQRGVNLLVENNIRFSLKSVSIAANIGEHDDIANFCRQYSYEPFRFDPLIHLRLDRDEKRNREIRLQRLTPEQIADLEKADNARFDSLKSNCDQMLLPSRDQQQKALVFSCGIGKASFVVSYNGYLRLCSSFMHPDYISDLRRKTIKESLDSLVPRVRAMTTDKPEFLQNCARCSIINLCIWCPAHAYLESGNPDNHCQYFCDVAKKRHQSIKG